MYDVYLIALNFASFLQGSAGAGGPATSDRQTVAKYISTFLILIPFQKNSELSGGARHNEVCAHELRLSLSFHLSGCQSLIPVCSHRKVCIDGQPVSFHPVRDAR